MESRRHIQAPVDWGSVSPPDLHCGSVHVVTPSGLCVGCVISDLSIGDMGVLSWVIISVLVIFICQSWITCLSCSLACHLSCRSLATCANCSSLHVIHVLRVLTSICNL